MYQILEQSAEKYRNLCPPPPLGLVDLKNCLGCIGLIMIMFSNNDNNNNDCKALGNIYIQRYKCNILSFLFKFGDIFEFFVYILISGYLSYLQLIRIVMK